MFFNDPALARRLERDEALNTADYAYTLERLDMDAGARVLRVAGGHAAYVRPSYPVNRAVGLGINRPVMPDDLDNIEAFYQGLGIPARMDLCPFADVSMCDALGRRGYRIERFFTKYVCIPGEIPLDTAIETAPVAAKDIDLWALTAARGFTGQERLPLGDFNFPLARLALRRPGVTGFLAYIGGEPAAAAALCIRAGLATLFSASTRAAYRGRGAQTALLAARLHFAAEAGCDLATTSTLPGAASARNVERAGFRVAYTRMTMLRRWV